MLYNMNLFSRRIHFFYKLINFSLARNSWHLPIRYGKTIPALSIISYFTKRKDNKNGKADSIIKTIEEADELFDDDKFLEAYEILINCKNDDNVEIQWRICRALYKMSRSDIYAKTTKEEMIQDAYDLMCEIEKNNRNNANVQKWMAILLDAKLRMDNKFSRIEDNIKIKEHLTEAYKLNPNDYTVLYMLGQWHFKLCSLSWLQRKFASIISPQTPKCNYEEALNYFMKAEELKPRYYLSNIYMLGKINYHMGNMYRAHYYLQMAAQMTPSTDQEEEYVKSAQNLIIKLKNFDVSDDAL